MRPHLATTIYILFTRHVKANKISPHMIVLIEPFHAGHRKGRAGISKSRSNEYKKCMVSAPEEYVRLCGDSYLQERYRV